MVVEEGREGQKKTRFYGIPPCANFVVKRFMRNAVKKEGALRAATRKITETARSTHLAAFLIAFEF